jgi:hypothetical protein
VQPILYIKVQPVLYIKVQPILYNYFFLCSVVSLLLYPHVRFVLSVKIANN